MTNKLLVLLLLVVCLCTILKSTEQMAVPVLTPGAGSIFRPTIPKEPITISPKVSFEGLFKEQPEAMRRMRNNLDLPYTTVSTITLSTATKSTTPSSVVIGATKSLVMASLKGASDKNITTVSDVALVAKSTHITIGVHTILGIDLDYVEQMFGLSSSEHQYRMERMDRPMADCWMGSVFEYFDVVVTTDQYFTIMLRQNRDCFISKLKWTTISSKDLNMAYMGPFELLTYNASAVTNSFIQQYYMQTYLFEYMYQFFQFMFIPKDSCNQYYIPHDWAVLRAGQGLMNITQSDMVLVNKFFTNPMTLDSTAFNAAIQQLQTNVTMNVYPYLNVEMSPVVTSVRTNTLFPSSCYSCKTTECMWEDVHNPIPGSGDPISIGVSVYFGLQFFIYWPLLIYFRNKDSVKRRLFLPYLGPLMSNAIMVIQIFQLDKPCYLLHQIIIYFCGSFTIVTYSVILSRFILLRYLYRILRLCKTEQQVSLIKRLSSKTFVVIFSLVAAFVVACLVAFVPISVFRQQFFSYNAQYVSAYIFTLITIVVAFVAVLGVIINIILSSKMIVKKGLSYFLFFDDPFYVRPDAIFLSIDAIIVAISLFTTLNQNDVFNGITPPITHFFSFWYLGGFIIYAELFKTIIYRTPLQEEKGIEKKMENQDFYEMIKDYASKEFSLENILLYDKIKDIKRKSNDSNPRLSISDLEDIQNTFMKQFSRHEVNLPNETKQKFSELMKECKENKKEIRYSDLFNILYVDLMQNIGDTTFRLTKTPAYHKWELANKIFRQEAHASH